MIRLFRVSIPTSVLLLILAEVLLAFICFLIPVWIAQPQEPEIYLMYEGGFVKVSIAVGTLIFALYFHDLYENFRVRSRSFLFAQFCTAIGIVMLVQALLAYLNQDLNLSGWLALAGSALALLVLPGFRVVYSRAVVRILGQQRLLFLGENDLILEVGRQITKHPEKGYLGVGYLSDVEDVDLGPGVGPKLGGPADVDGVAKQLKPSSIVVGLKERRGKLPVYQLMDLRLAGFHVQDVSALHESLTGRISIRTLRPSQLVFSDELGPKPNQILVKEVTSFVIAMVALVVLGPIMLIVAALVRLTSLGPALYSQKRVGYNGKVFQVYKFRSMYQDAEARTGAVWAKKDDPRVTPLGKWLRLLRLDELPQVFNVLKGEMSIVGPRPERPEFVKTLSEQIPFYSQRHFVKPGITGWAQINHKYGDTIEDTITKLEFDLFYIKHMSPSLDMYIIFHTVKVMALSRGAQ